MAILRTRERALAMEDEEKEPKPEDEQPEFNTDEEEVSQSIPDKNGRDIPNKIKKNRPVNNIIGDPTAGIRTRSKRGWVEDCRILIVDALFPVCEDGRIIIHDLDGDGNIILRAGNFQKHPKLP
nr:uncharacterized protein LOC109168701 [Ipomoea trifida]